MSNTSEVVLNITDRGKFENLVASILRQAKPDYMSIVQTGVNEKGETIKSPIDGFTQIPNSVPDHYLILQTTTVDKQSLRAKWLHETNGDLIKTGHWV